MLKLNNLIRRLWKDESAQGTSEYILLLVVVIAVAFLFKGKIISIVEGQMDKIGGKISSDFAP
jgi:Flp pilus assembly pilin Flp